MTRLPPTSTPTDTLFPYATRFRSLRVLVAALGHALVAGDGLVDRLQVRQRQLGIDRLDVGDRIDLVVDMDHVVVLEAAHHVGDRIDLADRSEEHTSELQSLMRSSSDVFCLKNKNTDHQ